MWRSVRNWMSQRANYQDSLRLHFESTIVNDFKYLDGGSELVELHAGEFSMACDCKERDDRYHKRLSHHNSNQNRNMISPGNFERDHTQKRSTCYPNAGARSRSLVVHSNSDKDGAIQRPSLMVWHLR